MVGIILYGLLAGCAATTVIGLLPVLFGLTAAGIFNYLDWEYAGNSAARFAFYYVYSVPIGLIVGVVVCVRVWVKRLRKMPSL